MFMYCMYIYSIYIHKFTSYDCFANCVPTKPLDNPDLLCRSTNRNYRLCEIFGDNHKIAIIP